MDCQIINVTGAFAAVNLAGPDSRTALATADRLRPRPTSVPLPGAAHVTVAGVPCLVLRIGFVGELGYEIHYPSAAGQYLWRR